MNIRKSIELTSAITALANMIACQLTPDQTTLLASILVQLSDTLNTIVAQEALCGDTSKAER